MPQIGSLFVNLSMNTAAFAQSSQVASNSLNTVTIGSKRLQASLQNLGFQINDVVTGLATGQQPMRIFAQQAGQIVQLFTQGGGFRQVMTGAAQAVRNFITPTTVATTAVLGLAGGFGLLVARAAESEGRIRGFNVMLKGLGDTGKSTGADLEAAAKRLRDVGLSTSEAMDAMQAARRAGVSIDQVERIVRIGQDLIPALGAGAPKSLVEAITGGPGKLGDLVKDLGLVSAKEVELARSTFELTGQFRELDRWVALIEQRSKGANRDALSPMGQALRELGIAWGEMLDAMEKTGPIKSAIAAMTDLARVMKQVAEIRIGPAASALAGAATGAITGALLGRFIGMSGPGAAIGGVLGGGLGAYYGLGQSPTSGDLATGAIPRAGGMVDPERLVRAIIQVESGGNPNAVSSAGAMGLMQLMPGTARGLGVTNAFDPGQNVAGGTKYLQQLLKKYDGDVEYALMAYNWGPGNLDAALKGMKNIPAGVRGYASKVMGLAGTGGTGGGFAGGGAGGSSVLAQPGRGREEFTSGRQLETERLGFGTTTEALSADALAVAIRAGGGARSRAQIAAELETAGRFRGEGRNDPEGRTAARARAQQFLQLSQARGRLSLAEGGEDERRQTEQLQKQAELFGKSTEEIERQVALLKVRQQAEAAGLDLTEEAVKAREAETNKLSEANILLAKQRVLTDQIREVAGVFENAFSQAFDGIVEGTLNVRKAIGSLFRDLGKTLASSAFKRLIEGEPGGSGGLFGGITGLFGLGGGGAKYDFSSLDMPAFAGGGSFTVGGYGALDSQLVAFRASPGEMVDVTPPGGMMDGNGSEPIKIELSHDHAFMSGVADQRIVMRSGQIVEVAVRQSSRTVQRNFAGMSAEANSRTM